VVVCTPVQNVMPKIPRACHRICKVYGKRSISFCVELLRYVWKSCDCHCERCESVTINPSQKQLSGGYSVGIMDNWHQPMMTVSWCVCACVCGRCDVIVSAVNRWPSTRLSSSCRVAAPWASWMNWRRPMMTISWWTCRTLSSALWALPLSTLLHETSVRTDECAATDAADADAVCCLCYVACLPMHFDDPFLKSQSVDRESMLPMGPSWVQSSHFSAFGSVIGRAL